MKEFEIDWSRLRAKIASLGTVTFKRKVPKKKKKPDDPEELEKFMQHERDRNRDYRQRNPEKVHEREKKWRNENPEKVKAKKARFYEAHKNDPEFLKLKHARQHVYKIKKKIENHQLKLERRISKMIEVKTEHLVLDRAHIESAILNQASWFDLYASECSKQQNKVDRLKNELEYKSAQLKIQIRSNAEAAKVKLTQDQVDCALVVEPEIKMLKDSILDEEEYLGQLKAAVSAMQHKRDSIENEIRLITTKASMLNGDCAPETISAASENASENVNRAANEAMRNR